MSALPNESCATCGAPATQRCSKCRVTRYCGKEHQRAHWATHRAACRPYVVATSEPLGRHWVAARDIDAGEVLLEERPLVVGPKAASLAVCLTCYARPPTNALCSGCGWPSCGPACSASASHRDECKLIAGHYRPGVIGTYCFVMPVRCMLLRGHAATAFQTLQSHVDTRSDTPLYRAYAINVVAFALDRLGLRAAGHDERSAFRAAAVLDTNAFDVRRPGGRHFRALYVEASLMAHDCTPNTKHVFVDHDHDGPAIRVVATVPIGRGQPVTATYTQTLWGTRDRRRHLLAAKCFRCECRRCADPAELGAHLGSDACRACPGGRVPPDHGRCSECGHEWLDSDRDTFERREADAERHVRSLQPTDLAGFELFLEQVRERAVPLHHDHHVAVGVKYALVQLYGDTLSG